MHLCPHSSVCNATLKHLPNSLRVLVPIQDNMLKRESFKKSKILHNQPSGLFYLKTIPYSASSSIVFTSPSRSVLHIKKSSAEF